MKILKPFWIALGFVCVALGALGVPLPVLPTTPFLLLAAFCFAKGSQRLDAWFKGTRLYKNHLESFVQNRAMTLRTKLCILIPASIMLILAFVGMCQKDTTGTRIGRAFVALMFVLKYVYFFTRIRTIPEGEAVEPHVAVAPLLETSASTRGLSPLPTDQLQSSTDQDDVSE